MTTDFNFISLKPGSDETCTMHNRSDNKEFMTGDDTDEIIEERFESFLQKYEENLQNKMRGSEFEFDGVNFLYYDFNKISLNRCGSYMDSLKWLKDKKSTINHINNDGKGFQYAVTLALNLDKIRKNPQRISKIKPFMDQYNCKDIDLPSTSKDWRKLESNNEIALNVLCVPHNTRKINVAYKSKNNLTCDKQVISLMITGGEKWHYPTVKNLPGLFRGITSNHKEDFYCLNCFRSYRTKNKLEEHKKIRENHNYCNVEIPTKDNNIIKYNQGEKSIKLPFVVYAYLECLLEKMSTCQNNPNESSTTEINKHIPSGYSIFTHCSFNQTKNKLNYYRGKDCMKKFCKDLREHTTKIINYEKKKMIPLTKEEKIYHNEREICYICKKEFGKSDKKHYKVRDHCHYTGKYRGAAHNICNMRYKILEEIPVVFHNGSTYDYHFIIKELEKEFDGNFEYLGENTEKYIAFSVPVLLKDIKRLKLLKDIRDGLSGDVNRPNNRLDNNDDNNDDNKDRRNRPDNNDDNNDNNNDRTNRPDNDDYILKYQLTINDLLDEIEGTNVNNREYINKIKNQNDKILDLETKLKENKLSAKEILDEAGKVINKFKEDSLKHRNNYIGELAKSNDLYGQLDQVKKEYEHHTRDFDEEVIANNETINILIKNFEFLRKLNDEHKHITEQVTSISDDKDRNIEELKRDLDDALNKINNLNYELENKDETYEKLQKIENNNEELEKFIEISDDIVKEDKNKIHIMLNEFKKIWKLI